MTNITYQSECFGYFESLELHGDSVSSKGLEQFVVDGRVSAEDTAWHVGLSKLLGNLFQLNLKSEQVYIDRVPSLQP